jgi:GTP1/Obg family GTP-binding protein
MQAITALAHLQCCVLYFLDISEQCGYTLDAQLKLFESIRPLFANKQVMVVANKTDVLAYDQLSAHARYGAPVLLYYFVEQLFILFILCRNRIFSCYFTYQST